MAQLRVIEVGLLLQDLNLTLSVGDFADDIPAVVVISQTTIRHNAKFGVEDLTVAIGGRCDDRVQKSFDRQSDTLIRYVCFESIAGT